MKRRCALLAATVLALAACAGTPRLGDDEAALVLENILSQGRSSQGAAAAALPAKRETHYIYGDRTYRADLYLPAAAPRAAMIVLAGLNAAGAADPRLVHLARTLGRAGFLILVPDLPESRQIYMTRESVIGVVAAVRHLRDAHGLAYGGPSGLGGISFAAGPALIAALDPAIAGEVEFIVNVGGYYDLRNLISLYTTGAPYGGTRDQAGGARGLFDASHHKWIIALANAGLLEDAADRDTIREYARRRLGGMRPLFDPPPRTRGADAGALLELLENTAPERVGSLLERQSAAVREHIRALNPAEQPLDRLGARVYLIHGRGDRIIPVSESIALEQALPNKTRTFLLDGLHHVKLSRRAQDVDTMRAAVNAILAQRH